MSEDTLIQIREQGAGLLSSLEQYYYSNFSGLSKKPGIAEIFSSFMEFGDPELFHSISEKLAADDSKDKGLRLLRNFLGEMFALSRTSNLTDDILTLETRLRLKVDEKKIPYRSAQAESINEPKKKKRDDLRNSLIRAQKELAPHYAERRYLNLEAYEELGLGGEHESTSFIDEAKRFLKDTDYVSSEMLEWFFTKQMELPVKDASYDDLCYMLSCFELKAAFPQDEYEIPGARVLDDCGLVNSSEVNSESGIRAGKLPGSFLFLTSPPAEMAVSIFPVGGPKDYEDYLSALGSALSFVFTDRDEHFEFRYLRDPVTTELFSELFKNLIYDRKWLDRYIDYDRGKDFYKLLFLRRLMNVREVMANLIYMDRFCSEENEEGLRVIYKETMESALFVQVSEWGFMTPLDIRKNLHSAHVFESILMEQNLSKYLKENFDEEWWRVPDAGSELIGIWSQGGRIFSHDIEELTGSKPSASELRSLFERELG